MTREVAKDCEACESSALLKARGNLSDVSTVVNLLKMIMGAGGFAFPWAFARMGLIGGVVCVVCVAGIGSMTINELVALSKRVALRGGHSSLTYSDVAQASLGRCGAFFVLVMTLIGGTGAMAAYLAYISETLNSMFPNMHQMSWITVAGACLLPVTWMQDLSWISQLAAYGTLAVILGYVVTLYYAISTLSPISNPSFFTSIESTATGFGPVAFLLCVQFAQFPLVNASQASSRPGGFERLAAVALATSAAVTSVFGALGYLYFGSDVAAIVLDSLTAESFALTCTKLLVCIDLLCTYPLVFAATSQILERAVLPHQYERHASFTHILLRSVLVFITMVGGLMGFGEIVSLVGDISMTSMAYILPPIMTLITFRGELTRARWALNCLTLVIGIVVCILSSGATVVSMVGLTF